MIRVLPPLLPHSTPETHPYRQRGRTCPGAARPGG